MPGNHKFDSVKIGQCEENHQHVTKILSDPKVARIHQHAKIQAIPPMRSPENAENPKFDTFH